VKSRKIIPAQKKLDLVLEAHKGRESVAEIFRRGQIPPQYYTAWRKKLFSSAKLIFSHGGGSLQVKRLRAKVAQQAKTLSEMKRDYKKRVREDSDAELFNPHLSPEESDD
jgi:transposase-like protein